MSDSLFAWDCETEGILYHQPIQAGNFAFYLPSFSACTCMTYARKRYVGVYSINRKNLLKNAENGDFKQVLGVRAWEDSNPRPLEPESVGGLV